MSSTQMPELTGSESQIEYASKTRAQLFEMWNKPEFQAYMKSDFSKVYDQLVKVAQVFFFEETSSNQILDAYTPFKKMGNPSYDVLKAYYKTNKANF